MSPIIINPNNTKHKEIVNQYFANIKEFNEITNKKLGRDTTAKEIFKIFASTNSIVIVESRFNFFKTAFDQTGIEKNVDWDGLYYEYFGGIEGFKTIQDTPSSNTPKNSVFSKTELEKTWIYLIILDLIIVMFITGESQY